MTVRRIGRTAILRGWGQRFARGWPVGVIAVGVLLFFALELPAPDAFLYRPGAEVSDLTITFWPNVAFIQRTWQREGQIPLWRTSIFCGTPFAADPQSGLWYLPNVVFLFLPAEIGFNVLFVVHAVVGGLGMYVWATQTRTSRAGALLAGLAYAFTPRVFAHLGFGHVGLVYAAAYVPWVLWAAYRAGRGSWSPVLVWGLAWGWQAVAHLQLAFYTGLIAAAYATAVAYGDGRAGCGGFGTGMRSLLGRAGAALGRAAVATALGLCVAAGLLLPLMDYARLSGRAQMGAAEAAVSSLPPRYLLGLLLADHGGFMDYVVYVGLPVLWLAPLSLRRRQGRFWLVIVVGALLYALGDHAPLFRLMLALLPLQGWLRAPARIWFVAAAALSLAAGWGYDELRRLATRPRARAWAGLQLVAVATGALGSGLALGYWLWYGRPPRNLIALGSVAALMLLAVLAAGRTRGRAAAWLIPIIVADLWMMDATLVEGRPAGEVFAESGLGAYLAAQAAAGGQPFRVYSPSYSLPRHIAAAYGLETVDGVDPLYLEEYAAYMELASGVGRRGYGETIPAFEGEGPLATMNRDARPNLALLGLLNVRYVAAEFPIPLEGLREVARFGSTFLYENAYALPRAFVVGGVQPVADFDAALDCLRGQSPRQVASIAVVEADAAALPLGPLVGTIDSGIRWLKRSPNRLVLEVTVDRQGLLVLSQAWYPDWGATLDGHPTTVWRADGVLTAVAVPPGQHRLEFAYRPLRALAGAAISAAALLGLATVACLSGARRRRGG